MEKKNTLLLTVIAIATLLVAVVGATFAYFASNINTTNGNVNVDVHTPSSTSTFTAESTGDIEINVTSAIMQESNAGDGESQTLNGEQDANLTSNANINVTLNSPKAGEEVSCSYDLVFTWNNSSQSNYQNGSGDDGNSYKDLTTDSTNGVGSSDSKYYPSTYYVRTGYKNAGSNSEYEELKELTIEVASTTYTDASSEAGSSGQDMQEKNIDEFKLDSGNKITLLSDSITTDKTNGARIEYEITVRFYNLNRDQSHLMGKSFKGTVSLEKIVC